MLIKIAVLVSVCLLTLLIYLNMFWKCSFCFVDTCCSEEFALQEYCALWFKTRKCTTSISRTISSSEWRLNSNFHYYSLGCFLKQYWLCCLKSNLLWDFQLSSRITWAACIVIVSSFSLVSLSAFSALLFLIRWGWLVDLGLHVGLNLDPFISTSACCVQVKELLQDHEDLRIGAFASC